MCPPRGWSAHDADEAVPATRPPGGKRTGAETAPGGGGSPMIRRSPGFTVGIAAALAALAFAVAGCGSNNKSSTSSGSSSTASSSKAGKVAVLLPDTKSSVRWETQDRKYLGQAFTAAGVPNTIVNA